MSLRDDIESDSDSDTDQEEELRFANPALDYVLYIAKYLIALYTAGSD